MPPQVSIPVGIDVRLTGDLAQKLEEQRKKAQDAADQMRRLITESQRVGARVSPGVAATPGQLQNAQRLADLTKNLFTTQIALGALTANITSQMVRGDMAKSIGDAARVSKTLSDSLGDVAEKQKRMLQPATAVTAQIQNQANAAQKLASIVSPSRQRPGKMAGVTDEDIDSVRARMRAAVEDAKKQNADTAALISSVTSGMPTEKFLRTGKGKGEGRSGVAKDLYELLGKEIQDRHQQGQLGELLGKLYTSRLYTQDYRESVRADVRGAHSQSMYEASKRREDQAIRLQMMLEPEGREVWKEKATSRFQDIAGDAAEKERRTLLERELIGGKEHLEALENQASAMAEVATNARKEAEVLAKLVNSGANLTRILDETAAKLQKEFSTSRESAVASQGRIYFLRSAEGGKLLRGQIQDTLGNQLRGMQEQAIRQVALLSQMATPAGRENLQSQSQLAHADLIGGLSEQANRATARRDYMATPQGQANLRQQLDLQRQIANLGRQENYGRLVAETGRWNAALTVTEQRLGRIRDCLRPIESISTRAFAGGLGLMLGTAAVASPVHMTFLGTAIKDLAAVIGYQFIPYVAIATEKVRKLADIILSADGAAKSGVAKWIAYGTAIAGVGMVAPRVIGAVQGLLPILRLMTNPIGAAIGLGVAGIGLAVAKNPELGKQLFGNLEKLGGSVGKLFEALRPAMEKFGESLVSIANAVLPLVAKALQGLAFVVSRLTEGISGLHSFTTRVFGGGGEMGWLNKRTEEIKEAVGLGSKGRHVRTLTDEEIDKVIDPVGREELRKARNESLRRAGIEPPKRFFEKMFGDIDKAMGAGLDVEKVKKRSSVGAAGIGGQFLGIGDIGTHYQLEALKVPGIQGDIADNTKKTADATEGIAKILADMAKELERRRNEKQIPPIGR
jgi:hypothetical protein